MVRDYNKEQEERELVKKETRVTRIIAWYMLISIVLFGAMAKWRRIDIFLLAIGETIPILGLCATWLGMPFERTGYIFLVSIILMFILMPVGIKIRGKLEILRRHHNGI